jgi:single-strand DNA-binding protein
MGQGDVVTVLVGNLTADPETRDAGGSRVTSFTIASTPRVFDRQSGEYRDGEALFMRCAQWKAPGENVAASLKRGDRVIAQGRLRQRSFEKDGQKRTVIEMEVDEIGPSLRYAQAVVTKSSSGSGSGASSAPGWDADSPGF